MRNLEYGCVNMSDARASYCPAAASVRGDTCRQKKAPTFQSRLSVFALPIFTASHPATIVGVHVLNFCVRDGNRWTHMTINTNFLVTHTGFEPMLTA